MKQFLQQLAVTLGVVGFVGLAVMHFRPTILEAHTASPHVWDSGNFESEPAATDSIGQGDDHIRLTRIETRRRGEVEHSWGTIETGDCKAGGTDGDCGRHREGAARTFLQDTVPTALAVSDDDGSAVLDDGRLWVDSDGRDNTESTDVDNNELFVFDDTDDDTFEPVLTIPVNSIIIWDEATGDENCDGTASAGNADRCPCGYVEVEEFQNIMIRGAAEVSSSTDIPEEVGTLCDDEFAGSPAAACAAGADNEYDDTLQAQELPGHTHGQDFSATAGDGSTRVRGTDETSAGSLNSTAGTGGNTTHYHPFRTVLFCKKCGPVGFSGDDSACAN